MNNYPEYAEVNGKRYKINTDFRVAIQCNEVAENKKIGELERGLAVIYLLFGDEALEDSNNHFGLLKAAKKFLSCEKELEEIDENKVPDMDYLEDMDYIEASFMSDYHIDLSNTEMHWYKFTKLINGLSNSEFGNCCVLNSVRSLRNYDVSTITDQKQKDKIIEAKKAVELKKYKKENNLTDKQLQSINDLYSQLKM